MTVIGVLMLILPYAASLPTAEVLTTGDNLTNWGTTTNLASVSLSTSIYYSAPSSVGISTNITGNPSQAYEIYYIGSYGTWKDLTSEPLFNLEVYPTRIAGISFTVELIIGSFSKELYYPSMSGLVLNQWNNVTIDFRTVSGGWDYATSTAIPGGTAAVLTGVWGIRFHWISGGFGTDFVTYVDDLQLLSTGPTHVLTISATTSGTLSLTVGPHAYSQGTQVTVIATPSSGYVLDHFVLDSANVGSMAGNQYIVTMDADHTLGAVFTQSSGTQTTVVLSATTGGTTTPLPGTYQYSQGLLETYTAVASSGYIFDHWVVDGTNSGTSVILSVTLTKASYNIQAVFTPSQPPPPPPSRDWRPLISGAGGVEAIIGVGLLVAYRKKEPK